MECGDATDASGYRTDFDIEPRLLADLTPGSVLHRFAGFDTAARKRPVPLEGLLAAPDEEDSSIRNDQAGDAADNGDRHTWRNRSIIALIWSGTSNWWK